MKKLPQVKALLIFQLFILISFMVKAQNKSDTLKKNPEKNHFDIIDYIRQFTKIGSRTSKDTAKNKSLGPFYILVPYPGYALVTGFSAGLVNNLSFYTHRDSSAKISTIFMENIFTQYDQSLNRLHSNIWLDKEKYNLIGDWRFYKFPTNTYGLGGKTTNADKVAVDFYYLRFYQILMRRIAKNFLGGLGYSLDYHYKIKETYHIANESIDGYGLSKKSLSSGITFNLEYDNRLNSNNPARGMYLNLQFRDNFKKIGSDNNWSSAILDLRYYIPLSKKTGNRLALWTYNWIYLAGTPPYFDLPANGSDMYNNTAREYVEGRYRGLNYLYAEAEYRFRLTKNEFLGGVLFSNVSAISEWPNEKFDKAIPGAGFGLRIKMNKYSNTNLCIDYGFGIDGAKGFSFNLNEVF